MITPKRANISGYNSTSLASDPIYLPKNSGNFQPAFREQLPERMTSSIEWKRKGEIIKKI